MEWFKHESRAITHDKIQKLLIRHGPIGYAVYFHCLELITSEVSIKNVTFQLKHDSELIAHNLMIKGTSDKSGQEIVEGIMRTIVELDLLQSSQGYIYGLKLLNRLDTSMTGNPKMRQLITKAKEHHDTVMTESCKNRIEENRIDKNRIEENKEFQPKQVLSVALSKPISPMKNGTANLYQDLLTQYIPAEVWGNIGKERSALNTLAKKTEMSSKLSGVGEDELTKQIIFTYLTKVKEGKGEYWKNSPITPSGLLSKWDSIINSVDKTTKEAIESQQIADFIKEGF